MNFGNRAADRRARGTALSSDDHGTARLRVLVAVAGGVYLVWWFAVESLLPGSFNPLPGRLLVVALSWTLLAASYASRWVASRLSLLFTAWVCVLVAHYVYLLIGNGGAATWWVGAFVTFAATGMCLQSPREVAFFSLFALGSALYAAALEGQLAHSIYLPGLATILLLAYVTKRSQAATQAAMLQAARARSESRRSDEQRLRLAAIVESSGDAIIGASLDGIIQSWNKGAERAFGYGAAEAVGRPLTLLLAPGQHGDAVELTANLVEGAPAVPLETLRRRKDGSDVTVSMTISPIRDADDALVGVSLVVRDISIAKRAESVALRAREAIEAANRDLEAFNYSVAHDLRAPLRSINGFCSAILEDYAPALDAEGRRYLQRVCDAAQHMGNLIDGLLALGRLSRVSIHHERVDLSELARATAGRLKESDPGRAVEFLIGDGYTENGDRALLGAAMDNLLGNAWKFTRNQAHPRIEFGATREAGQTAYFVRDNGAGFDMAFASKLFGVFERLHRASEFEGTGVGLATVQRIMRRHGGRIWGEGKVGEGACFYFSLGEGSDPF